ncbi:oxidoreductase [Pseudomonas sp. NPDC087814]|jgi:NAD(P)-dependent dehydrogenase (short-subunit alcohol dehydrogenase family)|uniref:oxidoreductase n=1 Tax=unclassified Pseudomonas TaxID=196821 RepID=UPI0015A0B2C2|nr:oxidoreductase [Pseudomonas sp. D5002]NWB10279.1 SDR family NAD(P)-dependent oxidoreductase [Pseudomonas sp. D5002]
MPTVQKPIHSGYGAATTAAEVIRGVDLSGKVAIVTGGYSGIGLVTARTLAAAGARVIIPARDLAKARAALKPYPQLQLEPLDLMDAQSIEQFAERFLARGCPLHLLINNAGIMAPPLSRNALGYESQFATNHLGHFLLTQRLWPALQRAEGARVVTLSSRGHVHGAVDFDDWNFERQAYDPWRAYGQSKTANALFAVHLDTLGAASGVRAFAVHPGGIITDLVRHMKPEVLQASGYVDEHGKPVIDPERNMKTPEQGAATSVWCAVSGQLAGMGGVYCENCDVAAAVSAESEEQLGVRPWAVDTGLAQRLWILSEQLVAGR